MMDPLILARIQFAANISFHILFPTITIAMGWLLLFFNIRHRQTGDSAWQLAYRFWVKVFALSFALGVVSGITMSFQFGTNWPGFMATVGPVAGPLLAYEELTAFFLEATFLGIMLFGQSRLSPNIHTTATFLVAVGTSISAFWIISLNSWMHTPSGYEIRDGVAHATDWWHVVFNPSMPYRFTHTMISSGLTSAFLVAGLSAYRWLRGHRERHVALALRCALWSAAILAPLQVWVGDLHGLNTLAHQPAKVAAIEGIWHTEQGAGLRLLAWPDEVGQRNHFEWKIPHLASLILTHQWDGTIHGLSTFTERPMMAPLFFSFRLMVGIGLLMWLTAWVGCYRLYRQQQLPRYGYHWLVAMTFSGWVATLAGWYTTEMGRQPWLVQGILHTADATSSVPSPYILTTLVAYLSVYLLLLIAYISTLFYLARSQPMETT